ncbi:MAG: hypothetical protein AAF907_18305 [Planctomycetota bacterium]
MFDPADRLLFLSALRREFPSKGLNVYHSDVGVGRKSAHDQASFAMLVSIDGPDLAISVGYCGALDPALNVGDVVTASEVLDPEGRTRPAEPIGGAGVRFLTVDKMVTTAADKAELFRSSGAAVVEMEASAVAEACAEEGVRFAAVKVVTDAAGDDLPPDSIRFSNWPPGRSEPRSAASPRSADDRR